LHAPDAREVSVAGSFCDWRTGSHALKRNGSGGWTTTIPLPPGRYEYRFVVDGEWRDEPQCIERVPNPFGTENCVLHVLRELTQAGRSPTPGDDLT
jgi:1,4-alpha-glucan branching enzyme